MNINVCPPRTGKLAASAQPRAGLMSHWKAHLQQILLVTTGAGLAAGGVSWAMGHLLASHAAWATTAVIMLVAVAVDILVQLRRGKTGVDILALLAILGALLLDQYFAGGVIAFMLASGHALEEYAGRRAQRELSALLARQPRTAHRYIDGSLEEVLLERILPGDRLLVRVGEMIPVDGLLLSDSAMLDEAALTGESLPVSYKKGAALRSGTVNAGQPVELEAMRAAADSTYAGVIRLVSEAREGKAPFTRLADRYALWFIPVTLVIAGAAWLTTGQPVRALAVLVVATPCPLILAAPVAIISGISLAARRGILIKNGGTLEALARARTVMFDKTGTLTTGLVRLAGIETDGALAPDEALRLAASLDQASQHVSARAIVEEARRRSLPLTPPEQVNETPGAGLAGYVGAQHVRIGQFDWLASGEPPSTWASGVLRKMALQGQSGAFLEVDGRICAALLLADEIRLDTARALRELRRAGIRRTVMVSGDRQDVAQTIASALGIDTVLAERAPADKVAAVETERSEAATVMVGDGINDAPALAAADIGIAMGARGAAASSEAADAVLLVDRLDRLAEAIFLARRSRRIALQSVLAGMGLSIGAMGFAAFGFITPVFGALLQEIIDVAVIANALRALAPMRTLRRQRTMPGEVIAHLRTEHDTLLPILDRIDAAAQAISGTPSDGTRQELEAVAEVLRRELLPHEREDEQTLYPKLAGVLRGTDPMAAMSRTHREIFHLARLYERLINDLPPGPLPEFELGQIRRLLYSLGAILRLHFAQEDEVFQAVTAE